MVAEFLAVLDVAATSEATEELLMLQDASDTLMRAIARVRIEVDRTIARRQGVATTNSPSSGISLSQRGSFYSTGPPATRGHFATVSRRPMAPPCRPASS
jgi:hypothetical protein